MDHPGTQNMCQPVAPGRVGVGDDQLCARVGEATTKVGADIAGTLHRDGQSGKIAAESEGGGGLHRFEHAAGSPWRRIAACTAFDGRPPGDMARHSRDLLHVGDRRADIFGGDIAAAEFLDRAP